MDRSWMYDRTFPRKKGLKPRFTDGVEEFLNIARVSSIVLLEGEIRCPCKKCKCQAFKSEEEIRLHLYNNGFMENYFLWTSHGERAQVLENRLGPSSNTRPVNVPDHQQFNMADKMISNGLGVNLSYNQSARNKTKRASENGGTESTSLKRNSSGSYEQSSSSVSCQLKLPNIDEMHELYKSIHEEVVQKALEDYRKSEEEKHAQRREELLAQQQALMDQRMQQMMEERSQMQALMRDMHLFQKVMMQQQHMQVSQQLMMQQQHMPPPFNNYQSSHYQQNATFVPQSSSQYQNAQQSPSFSQQNMFRSMPNMQPLSTPLRVPNAQVTEVQYSAQTAQNLIFDDENEEPNNIPQKK